MCGIFGVLDHRADTVPDRERLELTARLLHHRGPDHHDVFAARGIALGATRLALVDLSPRSNQPFWDRERRYCLVYNGEVYNFRELRAELEAEGVVMRTTSDTEVVLESLIRRGADATLPRLEGMFAFALWDTVGRRLTMARDRFGIKPLHVYDRDDVFVFASEIQAMRPWIPFAPDVPMISSYLLGFGGPTSGPTFYKHVRAVPPGTVVTVSPGSRGEYRRFWRLQDFWDPEESQRLADTRPARIVDALEERLLESVRTQLLADAPVGVLASGGVDSSLVIAMAARFHGNLAAFHADVVGRDSEHAAAAALARHAKVDLHAVKVVDQDSIDTIPEVMRHHGYPFTYQLNSVPFLKVSKLARHHGVKGVLSGEAADESYIGYQQLVPDVLATLREGLAEAPRVALDLARRGLARLRGVRPSAAPEDTARIVRSLLNRFETDLPEEEIRDDVRRRSGGEPVDRDLVTLWQLGWQLRTLLHRNDCLGMAASIEARFPFLDSRVVRLAANMPYSVKVRPSPTTLEREHPGLRDKWVLRKVAERYLPRSLAYRKKRGFPISAHQRMRITPELFDGSFVADLFELGSREVRMLVARAAPVLRLRLLHVDVWGRVCLGGVAAEEEKARLQKHVMIA
jgi:asparagine synthase (glutamine-hydrolysing)